MTASPSNPIQSARPVDLPRPLAVRPQHDRTDEEEHPKDQKRKRKKKQPEEPVELDDLENDLEDETRNQDDDAGSQFDLLA